MDMKNIILLITKNMQLCFSYIIANGTMKKYFNQIPKEDVF
jgi:hypothetical protein